MVEVICTLQRRSGASKNAPSSAPRDREHELALQVVCTTPSMICVACKCPTKSFLVKCSPVLRTIVCHICDTSPSTSGAVSVRYVRTLTESQRHTLETLMKHDPSPRARARAHSILLSSRRVTIKEIVKIYQVDRDTVSSWIKKWEQTGVESLYDKPRSGRPSKLTQEEKELAQHYIQEEPRCLKQVAERLSQKTAKRLSISSLKRLAKKARLRWKRVRKSLKSLRDPEEFAQCQRELEA